MQDAARRERGVRVGLGTDVGAGTSVCQLRTLGDAYKVAQLAGAPLNSIQLLYLATAGGARALYLDDLIGAIAPGYEADLVVLDLRSTPFIDFRMNYSRSLEEALLVQIVLGDDRAVRATYVAGVLAHDRDSTP
jgi:guanine deaminase